MDRTDLNFTSIQEIIAFLAYLDRTDQTVDQAIDNGEYFQNADDPGAPEDGAPTEDTDEDSPEDKGDPTDGTDDSPGDETDGEPTDGSDDTPDETVGDGKPANGSGGGDGEPTDGSGDTPGETGGDGEPTDGSGDTPGETGGDGEPTDGSGDTPGETGGEGDPADGSGGGSGEANQAPVVEVSGETTSVVSGRVTTLNVAGGSEAVSLRILDLPDHGNVTVNPDGTLALVLTGESGTGPDSFSYEITLADGRTETRTVNLELTASPQTESWGEGNFYQLATDAEGNTIVETGENHRKVYISGSSDALGRADIAAREGLSVNDITTKWLVEHSEYGATQNMALDTEIGLELWASETDHRWGPTSNWLLFERGYEYSDMGRIATRYIEGESELNPVHITAWGAGEAPVIHDGLNAYQGATKNVVVTDLKLAGSVQIFQGENWLFDNVTFSGEEANIQGGQAVTIRNSAIIDAYREDPVKLTDEGRWEAVSNRMSGLFAKNMDGFLIEGTFVAQNGWAPDYRYDMSSKGGHPPSFYSHNLYIQRDNLDVTIRDNIIMDGPSTAIQFRSGGVLEDNVILNNNMGFNIGGGGDGRTKGDGIREGNYSLITENVVTSAAHREVADKQGNLAMGIEDIAKLTSFVGNIVAHLADPNNSGEWEAKSGANKTKAFIVDEDLFHDDTIVYNWHNAKNADKPQNIDGLDTAVLDQTTIQKFTADLLGKADATISDLADTLRAQANGQLDEIVDADLIIAFFQQGFGLTPDIRAEAETLRFVPSSLADGIRWDNRLNWSTEDLPGTQDGDSVDLGGNWVVYGGDTLAIDDFDFGSGGELTVGQGRLQIDGEISAGYRGGELTIQRAGQVWVDGYDGGREFDIGVTGGRFANTGRFDGKADLDVSGNGQAILATGGGAFVQAAQATLDLEGGKVRVGFDGTGGDVSALRLHDTGTLHFAAENGEIGRIGEFRSGAFGQSPDILSGIDLGGATLELDVSDLSKGTYELMSADEIVGTFDRLDVAGLEGRMEALITVDYEDDTVSLTLMGSQKTGVAEIGYEGLESAGDAELLSILNGSLADDALLI